MESIEREQRLSNVCLWSIHRRHQNVSDPNIHRLQLQCPVPLKAFHFYKVLPSSPNSSTVLKTHCWRSPDVTFHACSFRLGTDCLWTHGCHLYKCCKQNSEKTLVRTQQCAFSGLDAAKSIFTSISLPGAASRGLCKRNQGEISKRIVCVVWFWVCKYVYSSTHALSYTKKLDKSTKNIQIQYW